MRKKAGYIFIFVAFFIAVIISGNRSREYNVNIYDAMDTFSQIKITGKQEAEAWAEECRAIIYKYDKMLSPSNPESEIYKLNNSSDEMRVSDEVFSIINDCESLYYETQKKFDITIGALSTLWSDAILNETLPDDEEILKAKALTDYSALLKDKTSKTIKKASPSQMLSLGSVAKGYIADKIAEYLDDKEFESAVIDLGGNIYVCSKKQKGENLRVGIMDPQDNNEIIGTVSVKKGFVVTSGDYQRFVQLGDKRYHHIINAKTGYPEDNGLRSVTIVADNGFLADALSTACFLSGISDGAKIAEKYGVGVIFVTDDKIYYSKNLDEAFEKTSSNYNYEEI